MISDIEQGLPSHLTANTPADNDSAQNETEPVPNDERRRIRRWHLVYYLQAFDKKTGGLLGHVVDINIKGLKLVGQKPIEAGLDFDVIMHVPLKQGRTEPVLIRAHSQWCEKDANPEFFNSGFRIIAPTPETMACIQQLIDALKF